MYSQLHRQELKQLNLAFLLIKIYNGSPSTGCSLLSKARTLADKSLLCANKSSQAGLFKAVICIIRTSQHNQNGQIRNEI